MSKKKTVRVSYNDLKSMIAVLDKMNIIEEKDRDMMNILIDYESVAVIGAELSITVEGAIVMDIASDVKINIVCVQDW